MDHRNVRRALTRKGFKKKEGGSHEKYYYYDLEGKKSEIFTSLSRKKRGNDVRRSLESDIAGQLRIRKDQFRQFVRCDLRQIEYDAIVREILDKLHSVYAC